MYVPKEWKITIETIKQQKRIAIRFEKRIEWIAMVKQITGARWEPALKAWHVLDHPENRKALGIPQMDRIKQALTCNQTLNDAAQKQINKYIDWMRTVRYSERTISSYVKMLQIFLLFYNEKRIEEITNDDVIEFNKAYILKKQLSASYQSQCINALKLFYGLIVDKKMVIDKLVRPQKPFQLPKVISEDEISLILSATGNMKHRTMLSLMYSAGLRRGELLNMKLSDIDSKRMLIWVRQAKGSKDRVVPLSPFILDILREYYVAYKPLDYLFEGQYDGDILNGVLSWY